MKSRLMLLTLLAAAICAPPAAQARIKLATLPQRERIEVQLDHGSVTLVQEERIVTLLKSTPQRGNNMIDFSWSNTAIDKSTILFRPIAVREGGKFRPIKDLPNGNPEVNVINVAYPPNENALVWEVYSAEAVACKVRVTYLIGNLTRMFEYRALADKPEKTLTLRKYLRLSNYSGEDFEDAQVWAGFGPEFTKPLGQQEEIKMLLHKFDQVPIDKTLTFDWYANGALNAEKPLCSRILMHYVLLNDEKHNMGQFPLQPGKVRIFIEDGRGGEAFLGEDMTPITPLDDEMKLYLGEARDVVCRRTIETNRRHNVRGNLYDQEIVLKYEIENFKDDAATLRIVEQLNRLGQEYFGNTHGDVQWEMGENTSENVKIDYPEGKTRPELAVELPPRPADDDTKVEPVIVRFHLTLKNLWN